MIRRTKVPEIRRAIDSTDYKAKQEERMSDCSTTQESTESCATVLRDDYAVTRCVECGAEGRPVEQQTLLHHVKHEQLDRVKPEAYHFCSDPNCEVVYFVDSGTRFTVDDLRELVSAKATGDTRPICYCFGFTEGDARKEIELSGSSTIPSTVNRLIKARMCACEVRNPSGLCCLGEVNRTVNRLMAEQKASSEPAPLLAHDWSPR